MSVGGVVLVLLTSFSVLADGDKRNQRELVFESSQDVYEELSTMSPDERMQILAGLQGSEMADLWRAQFNHFIRSHPEANAEQRAVIDSVAGLLAELYAGQHTPELESRMKDAQIRVLKAFPISVATQLFARLGADGITPERTVPFSPSTPKSDAVDCQCSQISDWCDTRAFCAYPALPACSPYGPPGCGFLLSYACDGMCKVD
ncbi:MAG TPA: bacteriocin fulvocin C-related protein [Thermoanaerobaculia bacterium]|nr:bacteriocin fulvocin C-related protein [Thermoanaerobaculia bacterium]